MGDKISELASTFSNSHYVTFVFSIFVPHYGTGSIKKKEDYAFWGCDAVCFVIRVLTFYFIATLRRGAHFLI